MNKLERYDPSMLVTDLDEYQNLAVGTAIYPGKGMPLGLMYTALGISGEGGEFSDHVKKAFRDDRFGYDVKQLTPERHKLCLKELGDILWYVSSAASELNVSLSDVANENLKKLYNRKERGVLGGSGDNR